MSEGTEKPSELRFVLTNKNNLVFDKKAKVFIGAYDGCVLLNEANSELAAERAKVGRLTEAGKESLIALATLKITDTEKRYGEISPTLRAQILKAHDLTLSALVE